MIARLQLGVRPAYSNLLSSRSRNAFGSGGFSVKPSYFRLRVPAQQNEWGWDYGFTQREHDDNRMTMISVGAGYQHNFRVAEALDPDATDEEKALWRSRLGSYPYVGVGLDLVGTKLRVPDENLDTGFKLGLGATLTAGYQYKTRWRLKSSVTALTSISSYNFSSMRVAFDYKM